MNPRPDMMLKNQVRTKVCVILTELKLKMGKFCMRYRTLFCTRRIIE